MRSTISLFLHISALASWWKLSLCQQLTNSPTIENFLRRAYHRAVVQGNFLYIDGGQFEQVDPLSGQPYLSTQNTTLSIDLRTSWTNESVVIRSIDKGNAPALTGEWLWQNPDGKTLYQWGGDISSEEPYYTLWTFTADGNGGGYWDGSAQVPSSLVRTGGSLTASTGDGVGYSVSGHFDYQPVQGIISYDFASQLWYNGSTTGLSPSGTRIDGQLVYTDVFGENGILVALGGQYATTDNVYTLEDLSTVSIYDRQSGQWLQQSTRGTIPESRITFCAVGVHSKTSMEIFIFGGAVSAEVPTFDEVYVLSLPSFIWYKADYPPDLGRCLHRCVQAGRQMIVVGGLSNGSSWYTGDDISGTYKDPWPWGLGVFDMSKMQWASQYSANAADYVTPDVVAAGIAANGSQPDSWTSPEIQAVFSHTTLDQSSPAPNSSNSATSASASASASSASASSEPGSSSAASSGSSKLGGGPIAGIAIGALALILLILGALWWMRKSKGRARHNATLPKHLQPGQHESHEAGGEGVHEKSADQPPVELDLGPNHVGGHKLHENMGQTEENFWRQELA